MNILQEWQGEIATALSALFTLAVCLYPPVGAKLTPDVKAAIIGLAILIPNIFLSNRKKVTK